MIRNKRCLNLGQYEDNITSWEVVQVSLKSSTQLIDRWMEQNLGVQENRNAGGMPQSNIVKQSISAD
jgi:hypothetical protein